MDVTTTLAALLTGLGLFFVGVRALSANLVPLAGRRSRAAFAGALRGPLSTAASGILAGLLTQSSTAVSWIILGFVRAGVLTEGPALMAPTWSNVGAAMLTLLIAINTATAAGFVIGLVGFAIYFRLDRTDRLRHMLEAALGAALLLFGMHLVSGIAEPMRVALTKHAALAQTLHSPWILAAIGVGLSLAAQSSSVAAALGVTAVGAGLLTVPAALPLFASANAASVVNNLMRLPQEATAGRLVFTLQAVQKVVGSLALLLLLIYDLLWPQAGAGVIARLGHHASGQIALLFMLAQVVGALVTSLVTRPVAELLRRLVPTGEMETLAQPAFLLGAALTDPPVALDLAMRELARLSARLPLLLDHVRAEPEGGTPPATTLAHAGTMLAEAIKSYLTRLLDHHPRRGEVAAALLLQAAAGNAGALHEALAELAAAAPNAATMATSGRLIEALHALMSMVADHAETLGADDPEFVLKLLGERDQLMEELRQRLTTVSEAEPELQDALFRMTILFERAVWLGRRLVVEMSQAQRALEML